MRWSSLGIGFGIAVALVAVTTIIVAALGGSPPYLSLWLNVLLATACATMLVEAIRKRRTRGDGQTVRDGDSLN